MTRDGSGAVDTGTTIELLGTSACHLCEQAEAALLALRQAGCQFALEKIDIAEDDALFAQYGLLIPVLRVQGGTAELRWPFDGEALVALVGGAPA